LRVLIKTFFLSQASYAIWLLCGRVSVLQKYLIRKYKIAVQEVILFIGYTQCNSFAVYLRQHGENYDGTAKPTALPSLVLAP